MAVISRFPTAHTPTTGFNGVAINPTDAYTDNTTYATFVPSKPRNDEDAHSWRGFDFSVIGASDTINSVTVKVQEYVSASWAEGLWRVALFEDVTSAGALAPGVTTAIGAVDYTRGTTDTAEFEWDLGALSTEPTVAQLQATNFGVRVEAAQGNNGTSHTFYVDTIEITVDYTPAAAPPVDVPWKSTTAVDTSIALRRNRGIATTVPTATDQDATLQVKRQAASTAPVATTMATDLTSSGKVQLAVSMPVATTATTTIDRTRLFSSVAPISTSLDTDVTTGNTTQIAKLSLTFPGTPTSDDDHVILTEAWLTPSQTGDLKIDLYQGASTLIDSWTISTLTETPTVYTHPIPSGSVANITDYSDLQLWVQGVNVSAVTAMRVGWLQLETPIALGVTQQLALTAPTAVTAETAVIRLRGLSSTAPVATGLTTEITTVGVVSLAVSMSTAVSTSTAVRADLTLASTAPVATTAKTTLSSIGIQDLETVVPNAATAVVTLRVTLAVPSVAPVSSGVSTAVTRHRGVGSTSNTASGMATALTVKRTFAAVAPVATSTTVAVGVKKSLAFLTPTATSMGTSLDTSGFLSIPVTMPNAASMSVSLSIRASLSTVTPVATSMDVSVSTTGLIDVSATMAATNSATTSLTVYKKVQLAGVFAIANSCTASTTRRRGLASVAPASSSSTGRIQRTRPIVWSAPTATSGRCTAHRRRQLSSTAPVAIGTELFLSITGFIDLFSAGYNQAASMGVTLFVSPAITIIGGTRPYIDTDRDPDAYVRDPITAVRDPSTTARTPVPATRSYSSPEPSTTIDTEHDPEFAR